MRGTTTALAAIAAARRLLAEQLIVVAASRPSIAERSAAASAAALSSSSLFRPRHQQQWWRGAAHESSTRAQHTCGPSCDHQHHHNHDEKSAGNNNGSNGTSAAAAKASLEQQEATCWSCNHATRRGGVVCQGCDRIQPLDSQALTYYELFGYGDEDEGNDGKEEKTRRRKRKWPRYALDARDLERRYRELQWALHPDRLTGPGREAREVQHGAAAAALVNQAYGVLRSPLARANYLLMLRRLPPEALEPGADPAARRAAEQRAAARLVDEEERRTAVDPALLMEVMEAREAVEEADDPGELRKMLAQNREAQARLVEQIGEVLDGDEGGDNEDAAANDAAATQRAQELAARLSYLVRIQQAIEAKL